MTPRTLIITTTAPSKSMSEDARRMSRVTRMAMYAVNDSAHSSDETLTVSAHAVVPVGHASSESDAFCTSSASVKLGVAGNSVILVAWEHLCKSCTSPTFAASGGEHSISLQHRST